MATQELLPVLSDWVHLLAAAPWVGGLFGFALVVWPVFKGKPTEERERILGAVVPRFSRVAVTSLLLLAVTGVYGALLHVASWEALVTTGYGQALLVKLALLVPILGIGAYNFTRKGRGPFRRMVLAELGVVLGIFLAVGFLTTLPPGKVEILARQGPFHQTVSTQCLDLTLQIAPNRVGMNDVTVTVTGSGGAPETGGSVGIRLSMLEHDMGTQIPEAKEVAPGVYQTEPIVLGMHGRWQAEVVLLTKQGREIRHSFTVEVPPPIAP